jgi:hypothetical protein
VNIYHLQPDEELGWAAVLRWSHDRRELNDQLAELLTDPIGDIHPELAGLWLDLTSMPHPARGLMWIRNNPHVSEYLRGLALGTIPLTHEGLHQLPSWRTAAHLRDLLMASGVLPQIDRQIALFERWSRQRLHDIADPEHARLLRQFATWLLLHTRAARTPLNPGSRNSAAGHFNTAARFLDWLANSHGHGHGHADGHADGHGRQPGRRLSQATQADLDAWAVQWPTAGHRLDAFLKWAMASGHMPRPAIPATQKATRPPISQQRRLAMLRRFLTDHTIPLRTRVAACLLLLYAQPIARLVRLTIDDIHTHNGETRLRLGTPASPVPEPFAAMLHELANNRANMNTATNPHCRWLFPGHRAGQPLTPGTLAKQLQAHSCPSPRPAPPRSASSCSRPPHPSPPTPSATTPTPPPSTSATPAEPGANTQPPTAEHDTHGYDVVPVWPQVAACAIARAWPPAPTSGQSRSCGRSAPKGSEVATPVDGHHPWPPVAMGGLPSRPDTNSTVDPHGSSLCGRRPPCHAHTSSRSWLEPGTGRWAWAAPRRCGPPPSGSQP